MNSLFSSDIFPELKKRFGIYSDPDHPGEFVFYTKGVDRI